ncbi:MAG TPA: MFS transporter [Candidatus Stackebrandtia excrementipullorum]|nr:MFS transporter [Candidatus Stackebrandtia excrementipullorum]
MPEVSRVEEHRGVGGHRDFRFLWLARASSQLGSAVGTVALPIIAVSLVGASPFEVALISVCAAVSTALLAFPIGPFIEFRYKRPIMVWSDVARFVGLLTVPLCGCFGVLTVAQLCAVAAVNAACQIMFSSASQSHLKALVSRERLMDANGRLEATNWLSMSVGPSAAGVLIAAIKPLGGIVVNAVAFAASAVAVWRIRTPEPAPPRRQVKPSRRGELLAGLDYAWSYPAMRSILFSWVLFAGCVSMATPATTIFYLRDLDFSAVEYGLIMGIPSLGGFIGARLTRRFVNRSGQVRTIRWSGLLRGPWYFLIPLLGDTRWGPVWCGVGFFAVLLFSGLTNSAIAGFRQLNTPDHLLTRVTTLWSFTTTVSQPIFLLVGGLMTAWVGAQNTLLITSVLITASALLLPRRDSGAPVVAGPALRTATTGSRHSLGVAP